MVVEARQAAGAEPGLKAGHAGETCQSGRPAPCLMHGGHGGEADCGRHVYPAHCAVIVQVGGSGAREAGPGGSPPVGPLPSALVGWPLRPGRPPARGRPATRWGAGSRPAQGGSIGCGRAR